MTWITAGAKQAKARRAAAWLSWVGAMAVVAAACSSTSTAPKIGCSLNSDCAKNLVCALGQCRSVCVTGADCPVMGSSCIDDGRSAVCQAPAEKNKPCTQESDCPVPLACASDYRCRNLCESDADCNVLGITSRVCATDKNGVDYCADPSEETNGILTTSPPPGAPSTPVIEPEGGTSTSLASLPDGGISANIGQGGGTIGAGGVKVVIPAGALSATLPISVQVSVLTGPGGTVSPVFEIGPSGTTFAQPITIYFDYTDGELEGLPPSDFAVETSTSSGAVWTPLSQIVVDVTAKTIAGQTTHLSPYALVKQQTQGVEDSGSGGTASDGGDDAASVSDGGAPVTGDDGGVRMVGVDAAP